MERLFDDNGATTKAAIPVANMMGKVIEQHIIPLFEQHPRVEVERLVEHELAYRAALWGLKKGREDRK